ncbi:hypothetical protein F5880DRAFT_1617354 [Lentinula raphanica]|nr:hypothetical protein F5880DRAFT_1617354 [Lentinula raphanica]
MLRQRIGVLAVGEAHMNAERRDEIERKYGKNLKVYYSKLPDKDNAAGVAFILNRNITNTENIQTYEITPGHAYVLEMYWHREEKVSILAIYAPNSDPAANAQSWERIQEFYARNPRIRRPDFMIGDCNMVEEPLDRLPAREEPGNVANAFDNLKRSLGLEDGWRNENPITLAYTYHQK